MKATRARFQEERKEISSRSPNDGRGGGNNEGGRQWKGDAGKLEQSPRRTRDSVTLHAVLVMTFIKGKIGDPEESAGF